VTYSYWAILSTVSIITCLVLTCSIVGIKKKLSGSDALAIILGVSILIPTVRMVLNVNRNDDILSTGVYQMKHLVQERYSSDSLMGEHTWERLKDNTTLHEIVEDTYGKKYEELTEGDCYYDTLELVVTGNTDDRISFKQYLEILGGTIDTSNLEVKNITRNTETVKISGKLEKAIRNSKDVYTINGWTLERYNDKLDEFTGIDQVTIELAYNKNVTSDKYLSNYYIISLDLN